MKSRTPGAKPAKTKIDLRARLGRTTQLQQESQPWEWREGLPHPPRQFMRAEKVVASSSPLGMVPPPLSAGIPLPPLASKRARPAAAQTEHLEATKAQLEELEAKEAAAKAQLEELEAKEAAAKAQLEELEAQKVATALLALRAQRAQVSLARATSAFELVELLVPRRNANEEIGDALEKILHIIKQKRPLWHVYLKVASTIFWVLLNAFRTSGRRVAARETFKRKS